MTIHISRPHNKSHEEARKLAEHVAKEMQTEFGMSWAWEADVLQFQRSGVNGSLTVLPEEIVVQVKLGFLLSALEPKITTEIHKFLDAEFA